MKFGFRFVLLISMLTLMLTSLLISGFYSHDKTSEIVKSGIEKYFFDYTFENARYVEKFFEQKTNSIRSVARLYEKKPFPSNYIQHTKLLSSAMDIDSVVISLDNGDAYWNQTSRNWPNHKYIKDVTTSNWYQLAKSNSGVSVTEPYRGSDGTIWISFVKKTFDGAISSDLTLDFLNEIVEEVRNQPGAVALIMTDDTTVIASSSDAIKNGDKANKLKGFEEAAIKAVSNQYLVQDYQLDGVDKLFFSRSIRVADQTWYFGIGLEKEIAYTQLTELKTLTLVGIIASIVVTGIVISCVFNYLYKPVIELRMMIEGLSEGNADLRRRLPVNSNDDLGSIAKGVNHFLSRLQKIFIDVQLLSTELDSRINNLVIHSKENAKRLSEHLDETEQVAVAIDEMSAAASTIAQSASTTAKLTSEANELGLASSINIDKSKVSISNLVANVESTVCYVDSMSKKSDNIHTILHVIGEIAEQTSLLALNAAIEAARAGSQGRGFAVVADEVRGLASRTKASTEEIEQALSQLIDGSSIMLDSMESTKFNCSDAARKSHSVSEGLHDMTVLVSHINDASIQIASSAEEQSSVTQEIGVNVNQINEIVSSLKDSGLNLDSEIDQLVTMKNSLNELMNQFRV